ncbi:OadG family protein [Desulfuribacillus alkaliarsenatis]|uniref:Uncharacterized protein n=1 Tax=Desulfuribacillus alkaliarsenatis TaxID=766136 RepID=A0A1E5FZV5_9FIRM|nr:OadG family protein [Desulfuribacillus alkaliarsenatis]OEF96102.1 hypothetical protein BHF68_10230 [Desulfuribacillus alkaliarsenatis]
MEILLDALVVALLGIVTVFIVLTTIILLIKLLNALANKTNEKSLAAESEITETIATKTPINSASNLSNGSNNHHIAVITAAICTYLGPNVRIRSIRNVKSEKRIKGWYYLSNIEQNR